MRQRIAAIVVLILLTGISLAACTAYAQPAPAPQVYPVTVTLSDTAITASPTTVRAGVRYDFTVTNHGTVAHQFWVMPATMLQLMKQVPMAQWQSHLPYGTQDIGPDKTAKFTYTFTTAMLHHAWAFGNYTPTTHAVIALPIHLNA
jgi:uncharacterized cupredoxin-like copper-binding protein